MLNQNFMYDPMLNRRRHRGIPGRPWSAGYGDTGYLERWGLGVLRRRRQREAAETPGIQGSPNNPSGFWPATPLYPENQAHPTAPTPKSPRPSSWNYLTASPKDMMRRRLMWHMYHSPEAKRRNARMRSEIHRELLREEQQRRVSDWLKSSEPVGGGVRPGANARYFNSPGMPGLTGRHPARERRAAGIGPTGNVAHEIPDLLNRPLAGVATGVNSMLDPKYHETFWQGMKRGLYGHGVESWGDVFRGRDPLARRLARYPWVQSAYRYGRDFVADTVFDPLNFAAPAKLLKYGGKGVNLLGRGLRTRSGRAAALGLGFTGAGLMYPDESEALVNLGKVYPNAYFFRGIDHRDPGRITHAFDVMDAFRTVDRGGDPRATEIIGSFVAPNALSRAYPFGLLMDVPDPSYIASMSPRSMLSEPYPGPSSPPFAIGRRTNEPINIEVQMPRSRPGRYSPEAYVHEPGSYNLDDLFSDMERGLDPDTSDRGNLFNQANYRYGLQHEGDPFRQVRAVVADPRYPEAAPFIRWAQEYQKPIARLPYTRNRELIRRRLSDPLAGNWIWEWNPLLNRYTLIPSTYGQWRKHQDTGLVPLIDPARVRPQRLTGRRSERGSW